MKKAFKVITLLMLVILVVTAFAMPASAKQVFTDLSPEHWCYAKIMDFEKKGYVCGYSDNTFRADRTITRAEYVKIVNNFFGYKPSEKTTSAFKDVNSGDWFMPYVNEAVDRGYIEGFEDGTFRPQDPIRRQEATVILARILKIDKEVYPADHKDGLAQYSDSDEVQEWARVAIHSYSVYNFINGYEDGTLRILRNVTRAETVELLHILEQKVVIDRKPGGGGTKTPTLKPDIDVLVRNLIEVPVEKEIAIKEEYTPVIYTKSNWINKKNSNFEKETARNGAFVNITSQTTGSTIHDTVDVISRKAEYKTTKRDEYDNKFFLTDGVYTVTAQATKSGRKDSGIETKVVKIDTVAPVVRVVETSSAKGETAHEQSVTVSIKDSNLYKTNEISGLDKVAYAWFNADTDERVTVWSAFELVNGQAQINAPLTYGKYKLGIAAIDVAENAFGTRTEYAVKSEDISGDVPTTPSGDVDYDFVKETESGDENPDQNPNGEELIVIVGNNNPTIEDLTMYTTANKLVSGELKGKDIDSGDVLSYELNDTPNYGTAEVNGNKTTYVSDKAGTYKYTVKVRDNHSGEAIGNVTVYVFDAEIEVPDAPSGEEIQDPINPNNPVNPDLSGEKLVLFVGEEKEMTASVTPSYEDTTYDWTFDVSEEKAEISSDSDECTVKVKGLKPGETKITIKVKVNVKAPNGGTETLEIEKQIPVIVLSKITIKIPDATKAYNGIPLKAEDFEVRSGDEALKAGVMADGDVADVRVSGERLYVGSSDATLVGYDILDGDGNSVRKYYVPTFEKGTLTVTANENEIIIKANSAKKKYDGTALKDSGYTYTSGVLVSGDVLEAVVSGEQLNVGSASNKVISYKVTRNGQDVTENYTFGESKNGVLEVTKRTITLTSASATKVYDGLPLTSRDVTVTGDGFVSGEGASYDVTGTITDVGKVDNEFTYTLNAGTLAGNYEITAVEGTLEVTPITEEVIVKVKGNSASGDKYDGQEKSVEGYEVVEITNVLYNSEDVSYSGDAIAKGINAGTYPMGLDAGKFRNNSKNFTNVKFEILEDGKLVIAKRVIELISASDEKEYDGTPLTNDGITVGGDGFVAGEGAGYNVIGTITNVGKVDNEFTYTLNAGTLASNYEITETFGTLTVTEYDDEIIVTITGNKATYKYDGIEKTVKGYTASINKPSLYNENDFEFSGEAKVTATNVWAEEYLMGLSADNFKNINDNFTNVTFVVTDGSLTITKRDVTLTSATDEKEYDGTPLINDEITVGGDGFASGEGASYNVTGTITNVGEVNNEFTYTLNAGTIEDNYNITKEIGKLTVKAKEEKAPNVEINIESDYQKNGKEAEPGDTIAYEATVKNKESGEIKVKIKIAPTANEIDSIIVYDEHGIETGVTYDNLNETITIPEGGSVKINYKSDVPNNHPVASDFKSTVRVTPETGTKETIKTKPNAIEKSVGVFDATHKDKNVILILDLSGSMNDKTKDGKTSKIKALRKATQQFTDKLYNSSKETDTKVTLNVIGIGEAHDEFLGYTSPSKKGDIWTGFAPMLFNERYDSCDAYLIDSYINTNAKTWISSKFIQNDLIAYGGTNIVDALEIANGIMSRKYDSDDGVNNFISYADNYVVILTDGANGSNADEPIANDTDGLKYSEALRNSGAGIYAIYFEGKKENENKAGKADLNTILDGKYPLYEASSADSLNVAFDSIASSINKTQSKGGEITATLPSGDKYLIIVTCKENNEEKTLITVNEISDLEKYGMEIRGNKLIWNISGTKYSACEDLKLKVTLDNTATDGKSTEGASELLSIESEETTVIAPVVDEKEDITSGDVGTSKENKTTVSGDTEIQNNDEAKSSETVSGEDKGLDNKDGELDNKENEQQSEEKNQEENVDGKEENQEVDNENQVNEVEDKQNEKVDNQKEEKEESEKETKEEPKLEEDNNEEKKKPMILEEKRDDDDSNDTSDSDKKIE